jgi:Dullard-like phosphatase family protein
MKIKKKKYQNIIEVTLPSKKKVKIGINIRPYWKDALNLIKEKYNIIIFTASHQSYANAVLDFMDPKKEFTKYRLYRNDCVLTNLDGVKFYIKDLSIFDKYYNLKDIVLIDNSVLSFAYHLYNGIPIVPYYEGDKDSFLYIVGLYLDHIYKAKDLREANKKLINLDYFSQLAKNKMENENGDIIDEESDTIEEVDENMGNDGQSKENTKGGDETKKSGKSKHKSKKSNCEPGEIKPSSTPKSVRKTIQDLSDKNLMCASNLFNLYLELKEQSNSNINKGFVTAKISKKESLLDKISFTNYTKIANNEKDEADNNDDYKLLDCKSLPDIRHPYAINNQYIEKIEENNDLTSKSMKKVKKVMTLCNGEAFSNSIKNEIMSDLEIIKSNFSHKFQGLDNKTDN